MSIDVEDKRRAQLNEAARRYRLKHKDSPAYKKKKEARDAEYRKGNRSKLAASARDYYRANKGVVAARKKKYAHLHRQEISAYHKKWRFLNRELVNAYQRDRYRRYVNPSPRPARDLSGRVFGRLTALHRAGKTSSGGFVWACVCTCGSSVDIASTSLIEGATRSCGCLLNDYLATLTAASQTPIAVARRKKLAAKANKAWRDQNIDKCRAAAKRARDLLQRSYVVHLLRSGIKRISDIPASLIEAKRVQLQVKRFIKEQNP